MAKTFADLTNPQRKVITQCQYLVWQEVVKKTSLQDNNPGLRLAEPSLATIRDSTVSFEILGLVRYSVKQLRFELDRANKNLDVEVVRDPTSNQQRAYVILDFVDYASKITKDDAPVGLEIIKQLLAVIIPLVVIVLLFSYWSFSSA